MAVWTVDTWRVRSGREDHFLSHCRELSPEHLILYRDLDQPDLFWSPAPWDDHEALMLWLASAQYRAAVHSLEEDVVEHHTHVMSEVPGFGPAVKQDT